jgi:hypothetical protein
MGARQHGGKTMNGKRLLEQSISTIEERQKMYGSPKENFEHIAKRWSLLLGTTITPSQVGLMMLDLKIARLQKNPGHYDSLIDVAGYAACLSELK